MNRTTWIACVLLAGSAWLGFGGQSGAALTPAGQFEGSADVGATPRHGSVEFDRMAQTYRITGGGENIWGRSDALQFVFSRVSGDLTLTADVHFEGGGKMEHRKAVLMVRQSLSPDAAYADVALHGDGLTSLQYRTAAGEETSEIQSTVKAPVRIRIERRGNSFKLYAGAPGSALEPSGPVEVKLQDPVYVGLGVCSHDAGVLETAVFSKVELETSEPTVRSKVSVYDLKSKKISVLYESERHFEAPNWSPDGKYLLLNSDGKLFRLPLTGGEPIPVDTGDIGPVNNDHGISADGKHFAVSAQKDGPSKVLLMTAFGRDAHALTANAPSYYHGWSPDGNWLAYCGERDGNFDIYRIPVVGGEEERLTSHAGYDDGPDYSPDGKWIYFNSNRSGSWDIWRMPATGAGPGDSRAERVTTDDYEDWFPHPSPDGRHMVFVSFEKGTKDHPANHNVLLRMLPLPGTRLGNGEIEVLAHVFGGQGTINVNSWAPDSKKFAFVSYELTRR
jgi:TolB protein